MRFDGALLTAAKYCITWGKKYKVYINVRFKVRVALGKKALRQKPLGKTLGERGEDLAGNIYIWQNLIPNILNEVH